MNTVIEQETVCGAKWLGMQIEWHATLNADARISHD
jgi:hypothetical protein